MFPDKNIPNHWKFVTKILHAIARLYLLYLKSPKFYLTISNFDSYAVRNVTIRWIFRFYSKKCEKLWYIGDGMTDLHEIWRSDAEWVIQVHRPLNLFIWTI